MIARAGFSRPRPTATEEQTHSPRTRLVIVDKVLPLVGRSGWGGGMSAAESNSQRRNRSSSGSTGRSAPIWALPGAARARSRAAARRRRARTGRSRRACSCRSSRPACRGCRSRARPRKSTRSPYAAALDRGRDRVDPDDEVLHIGVGQDHPAVAELVVGRGDGRCRSPRRCPSPPPPCRARSPSKSAVASGWKTIAALPEVSCSSSSSELHVRRRHREQAVSRPAA